MIEGTMDIARIESGKLTLDMRPLDFTAFMQQLVAMFSLQAQQKGLDFSFVPQGELPTVVRADEKRLRQILINLLGNAVKFTERGEVSLGLRYQREMATFTIRDTGPGIAPADQPRLFEPFERGKQSQQGGSGLGLTISKMLTDLMGGEIRLDSTPGQGALFTVRLFLPALHGQQAEQALPRQQRTGYLGPRRRILLVDNEAVDRAMLRHMLQALGFELAEASSGEDCLALLPAFRPHAVFMDLAMPGMDGWQTLRAIRQAQGGMADAAALAIISANAFEKGQDNDVGILPADFFVKPIRLDDILDWLGRRLQLEWQTDSQPVAEIGTTLQSLHASAASLTLPDAALLRPLREALELGYPKGVKAALQTLSEQAAEHGEFLRRAQSLVDAFRFDALRSLLQYQEETD
ncbi:hybrid sensor histidine kinase/response regulator [Aquitalea magnusonii]|uniref:ATP-binding response regulator n=1 Tax=Aquitalea magnusonii TaxID=332411 RepID=UPI001EFB556E|nr:ATP-binding protein [Aquitalea magnusonii]